jgi:hypothetical protein
MNAWRRKTEEHRNGSVHRSESMNSLPALISAATKGSPAFTLGSARIVGGGEIPFRSVLTEIPDRPVQRSDSLRNGHCERSISVEP